MTTSRRLAALPLLLIGLATVAACKRRSKKCTGWPAFGARGWRLKNGPPVVFHHVLRVWRLSRPESSSGSLALKLSTLPLSSSQPGSMLRVSDPTRPSQRLTAQAVSVGPSSEQTDRGALAHDQLMVWGWLKSPPRQIKLTIIARAPNRNAPAHGLAVPVAMHSEEPQRRIKCSARVQVLVRLT